MFITSDNYCIHMIVNLTTNALVPNCKEATSWLCQNAISNIIQEQIYA